MSDSKLRDAILFFAIGVERFLKATLWEINPVFVYTDQSFKNVAPLLYKPRLEPSFKNNKEFSQRIDSRVLSFRPALYRAKEFSRTVNKHFNTILKLGEYRDIIVHRQLKEINIKEIKEFLLQHFFNISKEYARERGISLPELIGDRIKGLPFLTNKYRGDVGKKIKKKLRYYKKEWLALKKDPSQADKLKSLSQTYINPEAYDHAKCPACENVAVFYAKIDYDYSDGQTYPVGVYPTSLRCPFCGFYTDDSSEMDYLKLHDIFYQHQ